MKLEKIDPKKLDMYGCIKLLIALGESWGQGYREAYLKYLKKPNAFGMRQVKTFEDALRGSLIGLDDSEIARLQRQVREAHGYPNN